MRILYAIQGTGNGHITVAREVLPLLKKHADVDILVSGTQVDVLLDYPVKYKLHGLSFIFGKNGGIDYVETYRKSRMKLLFKEIQNLPVNEYDLVLSDFEPVSAWACLLNDKACIGFSHQAAVVNKHSPKPDKRDRIGKAVLKYYAPVSYGYGFHFKCYAEGINTPVIRTEIRNKIVLNHDHYTVYLPSFSDKKIVRLLSLFPSTKWQVFSKHADKEYQERNIHIRPITNDEFIDSITKSAGVLCNAGFQTPAETLFLRKKLLVVPMKGQYEQHCNAAALRLLGVPVIKNIKGKQYHTVRSWIESAQNIKIEFPDRVEQILEEILANHLKRAKKIEFPDRAFDSNSKFRNVLLKKIFRQLGS